MPEITRKGRIGKTLIFSIDERVFSKVENKLSMITSRNIKGMSFRRWMATVPIVSRFSIFDSTRTSRVKPRLFSFSIRESVVNGTCIRFIFVLNTYSNLFTYSLFCSAVDFTLVLSLFS